MNKPRRPIPDYDNTHSLNDMCTHVFSTNTFEPLQEKEEKPVMENDRNLTAVLNTMNAYKSQRGQPQNGYYNQRIYEEAPPNVEFTDNYQRPQPQQYKETPRYEIDASRDKLNASGEDLQSLINFGIVLLLTSQKLHMFHFNCFTHSDHLALEHAYKSIENYADILMETIISITRTEAYPSEIEFDFGDGKYSKEAAIEEIESVMETSEEFIRSFNSNAVIVNILTDLCQDLSNVKYNLIKFAG